MSTQPDSLTNQEIEPPQTGNIEQLTTATGIEDNRREIRLKILNRVATNSEIVTDPESPSLAEIHAFLTKNFKEGEVEPLEVFQAELASNETPNSPSRFICVLLRDPEYNAVVSCAYGSVQNGIIAIRFTLTESHLHINKTPDSPMDRDDSANFINYRGSGISQEADRLLIQAAQKHAQEQGQECEAVVAEAVERSERYWNEVEIEPDNGLRRLYDPQTGKQIYYRLPPLDWNSDGTAANEDVMVENLQVAVKGHKNEIPTAKLAEILHNWWQVWYIRPESQFENKAAWERHKAKVEGILKDEILAPLSKLEHVVPKSRADRGQT